MYRFSKDFRWSRCFEVMLYINGRSTTSSFFANGSHIRIVFSVIRKEIIWFSATPSNAMIWILAESLSINTHLSLMLLHIVSPPLAILWKLNLLSFNFSYDRCENWSSTSSNFRYVSVRYFDSSALAPNGYSFYMGTRFCSFFFHHPRRRENRNLYIQNNLN